MLQRTCDSSAIRWVAGERLHHIFEDRVDHLVARRQGDHPAVSGPVGEVSYVMLEAQANRLARYLRESGIAPGDTVALLFDKSPETYAALLAVSKAGAAHVPLDASYPADRIAFIVEDSGASTVLSTSAFAAKLEDLAVPVIPLDKCRSDIEAQSSERLDPAPVSPPDDALCYIVYTSGSTGTPKGVAVDHSSIVNFIRVAGEAYDVRGNDRMYQGLTIAFDFSVEEIWIALNAGATLVTAPPGPSLAGDELASFLKQNRVTAFCCVPTLLATVEEDLPDLRFLLVSGEACPDDLITRWYRKGRRILNAYGPTETTVTATWQELRPGKTVTIGRPLPTYSVLILHPERNEALAEGETGEIGIAGIGLARGYVNRDDLTNEKFIRDFAGLKNNPSGRIYRSGDLGRINAEGEIEYLGRIDTQVKVRGYRIELTEIESVLLQLPAIAQAVVDTYQPETGTSELVAYYSCKPDEPPLEPGDIVALLRDRLPSYMVPAFFEELSEIPMTPANKADRKKLPPPGGQRLAVSGGDYVAPDTPLETALAGALADTLGLEQASVEDDFFCDLGAHSLLMARFAAEIRERGIAHAVSIRDIYLHPSIRKLAAALGADAPAPVSHAIPAAEPFIPPRARDYYLCGALQLLSYITYISAGLIWLVLGLDWAHLQHDVAQSFLRAGVLSLATFVLFSAVPVLLKWALIGRWRAEKIPVWSLRYFRFWLVKELVQINPMAAFAGTEFYNIYLRLLGARIGRNVVIFSRGVPVATDLLSIGDETILQKESTLLGYHAQSGYIHTGPVTIGARAYVGEGSLVDIDTGMGDAAQLGHRSTLLPGQYLPADKRFHGNPAEETATNFNAIDPAPVSRFRRFAYPALLLLYSLLIVSPLMVTAGFEAYDVSPSTGTISILHDILPATLLGYFGLLALGLITVLTLPRFLYRFLQPGRTYPLYGVHYYLFRLIEGITNARVYNVLFGDSSWIVNYFRWLGYELNTVKQTGTNFGTLNVHEIPYLCDVGSGTMVSDGLSMMNARISHSSFRLSKCCIGPNNYLGNDLIMPPDARTGANCLLATKVMIPVDGPLRENTGLLGSPAFEIPRATNRDTRIAAVSDTQRAELLKLKNAANLATIATYLFFRWLFYFLATLGTLYIWKFYQWGGPPAFVAGTLGLMFCSIVYLILVERLSLGFGRLSPVTCSIYDRRFWRVEHFWKVSESDLHNIFKGTPFRNTISRLLGIKVGRMVFDNGAQATERTLVEIGDYCTLNDGSVLQSHSLEEGVFKSDTIRLDARCTVGTKSYIHYGTRIGEESIIAADAFLMKGESAAPGTFWFGNPARAS